MCVQVALSLVTRRAQVVRLASPTWSCDQVRDSAGLTMRSQQVQKVERGIRARPRKADRAVRHAVSRYSGSPALEIRVPHVHVRHAPWLAERVADARLSTALATSLNQASRHATRRFLTTVLMTDIVGSTDRAHD